MPPSRDFKALRIALCAGLIQAISVMVGCGGSTSPAQPPPSVIGLGPTPVPQQMGSVSIGPQIAALSSAQSLQFSAVGTISSIAWSVNGIEGGNTTVGTVDGTGYYVAPAVAHSINVVIRAALTSSPLSDFATAVVSLIEPSQVAATANPQVAQYSLYLPQPAKVAVHFGPSMTYDLRTAPQPTPSTPVDYGGAVDILVAGMRGTTAYHLQALVTFANGATYSDTDHVFTTGPPLPTAPLSITTPAGSAPQPGIELFDTVEFGTAHYDPSLAQAFATDLQGNVIWTYRYSGSAANVITPIKLLPNGHLLLLITVTTAANGPPIPTGTLNEIREIDLAGNTIRELTLASFNQALVTNGFLGFNLFDFSHDFLALPNGHFVLLAQMAKEVQNVTGYAGTVNVAGDVLVDVDQNFKPDWVWSTFDHLNVNRHPFKFPDWTHSDALLYSPDDHDLLLSIRNQNWIVKIDFQDGAASGDILWRLGEGGDYRLVGGVDPTDWFYAQHGMNFFSPSTSGVFELGMLDDGDDRLFPVGVTCGSSGAPPCTYSTVPILSVDEAAKTATLIHHYQAPASLYSFFGGQADLLPNGDVEADFCSATAGATVQEYQPGAGVLETSMPIVWQAFSPGFYQYRALRLRSLYYGVQW